MSIDKSKIKTQDDLAEPAPMDKADERAEAEIKRLEQKTKRAVAEGLSESEKGFKESDEKDDNG